MTLELCNFRLIWAAPYLILDVVKAQTFAEIAQRKLKSRNFLVILQSSDT